EREPAALAERHRPGVGAERHRPQLRRPAVDPERALTMLGCVEETDDRVPGAPAAALVEAGAGRPAPARLPPVVAGVHVDGDRPLGARRPRPPPYRGGGARRGG